MPTFELGGSIPPDTAHVSIPPLSDQNPLDLDTNASPGCECLITNLEDQHWL